jgi:uncharacterized protein DUF3300
MRARAQANGKLQATTQETVTTTNQSGQTAIEIQPAGPQVIYVPLYDPYYVWGPPVWGIYPSLLYPAYGYGFGPGIDVGLYFDGWGGWGWGGWGWGWGPNWFGHIVFVNNFFCNRYRYHNGLAGGFQGRTPWVHDPGHRLGVAYPNRQLSSRFGAASQASRMAAGRSGNWHGPGEGNVGNLESFRGTTDQVGARKPEASRGSSNGRHLQDRQNYPAPAQRYQAPPQHFQSAPRMSAPHFGGGGFGSFGGGGGFHGGGGHGGRR